jgi:hypothetical protein
VQALRIDVLLETPVNAGAPPLCITWSTRKGPRFGVTPPDQGPTCEGLRLPAP